MEIPENSETIDLSSLRERALGLLYRAKRVWMDHGWIVIVCAVVVGLVFLTKALMQGPMYVSQAKMMASGQITIPEKSVFQEERLGYFGTQMSIIKSPKVLKRAYERTVALNPELEECAVNITPKLSDEAAVLVVSAVGSKPAFTQAYLEQVIESYKHFKRQLRDQQAETTSLAIQGELLKIQSEIEAAEDAKIDFQRKRNITFMREQGSSVTSQLGKLKSEHSDLLTQYNLLENSDIDTLPQSIIEMAGLETAAEYQKTKAQLQTSELLLVQYEKYMRDAHPKLIAVRDQVTRLQNILGNYREQSKAAIKRTRESVKARLDAMDNVISKQEKLALEFSQQLAEFEQIQARLDRAQSLYEKLISSVQTIDVSQRLSNELLSILEDASPAMRIPSFFLKRAVMGILAGLILGCGILAAIAMFDNRIASLEDLSAKFRNPVWSIIPSIAVEKDARLELLQANDTRPVFAEAYRNLRTAITHESKKRENCKVIAISSSIPGEGKTTVSANLAMSLGLAQKKVLIIDCDLRKGMLHEDLGMPNSKLGFSELLGGADAKPVAFNEQIDFISRGEHQQHPAELLDEDRVKPIIEKYRAQYDWIIIDTPPILAAEDATLIIPFADIFSYVIRANHTQASQVQAAFKLLKQRNMEPSGLILNVLDLSHPNYYHYKYAEYYHNSSKS